MPFMIITTSLQSAESDVLEELPRIAIFLPIVRPPAHAIFFLAVAEKLQSRDTLSASCHDAEEAPQGRGKEEEEGPSYHVPIVSSGVATHLKDAGAGLDTLQQQQTAKYVEDACT